MNYLFITSVVLCFNKVIDDVKYYNLRWDLSVINKYICINMKDYDFEHDNPEDRKFIRQVRVHLEESFDALYSLIFHLERKTKSKAKSEAQRKKFSSIVETYYSIYKEINLNYKTLKLIVFNNIKIKELINEAFNKKKENIEDYLIIFLKNEQDLNLKNHIHNEYYGFSLFDFGINVSNNEKQKRRFQYLKNCLISDGFEKQINQIHCLLKENSQLKSSLIKQNNWDIDFDSILNPFVQLLKVHKKSAFNIQYKRKEISIYGNSIDEYLHAIYLLLISLPHHVKYFKNSYIKYLNTHPNEVPYLSKNLKEKIIVNSETDFYFNPNPLFEYVFTLAQSLELPQPNSLKYLETKFDNFCSFSLKEKNSSSLYSPTLRELLSKSTKDKDQV